MFVNHSDEGLTSAFLPLTVANLHLSGTTCTCIPYHNLKAKIIRTV